METIRQNEFIVTSWKELPYDKVLACIVYYKDHCDVGDICIWCKIPLEEVAIASEEDLEEVKKVKIEMAKLLLKQRYRSNNYAEVHKKEDSCQRQSQ